MTQNGLKPKQIKVAEMLANPRYGLKDSEIIEACDVSHTTFYRWIRENDEFNAYVNKLIDKYTDAELAAVWKALIRKCKIGDVQAIKLFFELKGKYSQNVNVSGSGVQIQIIDDIPKSDVNGS